MKKNLLLTFVATALCLACAPQEAEETAGNLFGIVHDKTTGEPVPVVNLTLEPGGNSTVTGSDGSFAFKNLRAGEYTIKFDKTGYKSGTKTVSVNTGNETETHLLIERIPEVITIDRETLDFGDNASMNTLSFNIVNSHYIDLSYEVIENCGWITKVDPSSGELMYGKTGTVVLTIDRELLTPGVNETVVVVRTTGKGSSELTVRATGIEKKKPSLNTLEATEVKATSAMMNGEITDCGAPEYTERGFVYSESPMPDLSNTIAKMTASVTDDKTFSVKLNALTLGKTYYVRAYAINEIGTAYSTNQISFKTAATLPAVSISGINVDATGKLAMLYGNISDSGDPEFYEKGFVYSLTDTYPTIFDTKLVVTGDNHGQFETKLSALEYDTDYYIRAFASNEAGTAYSDMQKVVIQTALPTVTTKNASDMDQDNNIVVLHGEITDLGVPGYTEKGFVYSTIYESPTIYDSKIIVNGTGKGLYEFRSTELPLTKKYYVRAYAINAKGVAYGDVVTISEKDWVELKSIKIAVMKTDIGHGYWEHMNSLCEHCIHEGCTDWRLPTLDELTTMYNERENIGNFIVGGNYEYYRYWSSTSYKNGELYVLYFNDGDDMYYAKNAQMASARCVRTLD